MSSRTSVPAERYIEFEGAFRAHLVMPVIQERFGSKMAREIEEAVLHAMDNPLSRPEINYPAY